MQAAYVMPHGAEARADGVRFALWAPAAQRVELELAGERSPMSNKGGGWFELTTPEARAGTRYRFAVDGFAVPDPASRCNPDDVHGASVVVDPRAFAWPDAEWTGRPWHEAAIYELHVGTFSEEGTFAGVQKRLDYLASLGVTALELMPLADFPGARNWGYDGVLPFAPDARYGTPDDLKALIAAAHARELMVLVDVVYNHFGPEGNYLHRIAPPFFTDRHHTPWGAAIDFARREVREFFLHNALFWLTEYRADGLRLDAVHAIADDTRPDILTELAQRVREGPGRSRHVHLVLENDRNEARRLSSKGGFATLLDPPSGGKGRAQPGAGGHCGTFTAQWNDDFHHAAHRLVTGEAHGYYGDYDRPLAQLGRCLAQGFAYQGEPSPFRKGAPRGEPSAQLPPTAFVNFVQNHDQIGNRAFGERLTALAPPEAMRSVLGILLLAPSIPLLFMGEEFAAASPFLFFCDFGGDLALAVRDGRRAEFAQFPGFAGSAIPDPGAPETFARSKLDWPCIGRDPHASALAYYRELLALRAREIVPRIPDIVPGKAHYESGDGTLAVRWPLRDGTTLALDVRMPAGPLAAPPPGARLLWQRDDAWTVRYSLLTQDER